MGSSIANLGNNICASWSAVNQNIADFIFENPNAAACGEVSVAVVAGVGRVVKKFPNNKFLIALYGAMGLGVQGSSYLEQFFCGSKDAAFERIGQIDDFQKSMPQRVYNSLVFGFNSFYEKAFSYFQSVSSSSNNVPVDLKKTDL